MVDDIWQKRIEFPQIQIKEDLSIVPIDISALRSLFESDLFAFVQMVSSWSPEQCTSAEGQLRKIQNRCGDDFLRVSSVIVSAARMSSESTFIDPFDSALEYSKQRLTDTQNPKDQLPYVRVIAAAKSLSGQNAAASALAKVADPSLRELLVSALLKSDNPQSLTHALVSVAEAEFKKQILDVLLVNDTRWVALSLVIALRHIREVVVGQLDPNSVQRDWGTKVVDRIVLKGSPSDALTALSHVDDLLSQKKLVEVLVTQNASKQAARALSHITDLKLRAQLIAVIVSEKSGGESALDAYTTLLASGQNDRTPERCKERERLLQAVTDQKLILKALKMSLPQEEKSLLVDTIVETNAADIILESFIYISSASDKKRLIAVLSVVDRPFIAAGLMNSGAIIDEEITECIVAVISQSKNASHAAAHILWRINDPSQRLKLIQSITDPVCACTALGYKQSIHEKEMLVSTIVDSEHVNAANNAIVKLRSEPHLQGKLVDMIAKKLAHQEAAASFEYLSDAEQKQKLITACVNAQRSSNSCVSILSCIEDPVQRLELITAIDTPHAAQLALKLAKTREEKEILVSKVAGGFRNSAIDSAVQLVKDDDEFVTTLESSRMSVDVQIVRLTTELLADDLEDDEVEEICTQLFSVLLSCATGGNDLPDFSRFTTHGEAVGPRVAGRCILDAHRTRAFLNGSMLAIDDALQRFPNEQIFVADVTAGPLGALNIPLALLYKNKRVSFVALDIIPENVAFHKKVIERVGLADSHLGIFQADAITAKLSELVPSTSAPHVVITEAMMAALTQEPQVALMANLKSQAHPNANWVPYDIEIFPVLYPDDPDRRCNRFDERRGGLRQENVATLRGILAQIDGSVDRCKNYTIGGEVHVPPGTDNDAQLYLETAVTTFPGVVLNSGRSDITSTILLERKMCGLSGVTFSYPIGCGRESIYVTRVKDEGSPRTRTPWYKNYDVLGGSTYSFND